MSSCGLLPQINVLSITTCQGSSRGGLLHQRSIMIGPANDPIVVHCVCKLIYQVFKVFNLLVALRSSNKYLAGQIGSANDLIHAWASHIFIAGPKSQQKIEDLKILVD